MPVIVQFDLTRAEYLDASRAVLRRQWQLLLLPVCGVLLLVFGVIQPVAWEIGAGAVMVAVFVWTWWFAPRQRWQRDPAQAGPFTYRFDDSGIGIDSPAGQVQLPWDRVRSVISSNRLVLVRIGGSAVMVPRRAIMADDRERFDALLNQHTTTKS
jgi:hypothetical protein